MIPSDLNLKNLVRRYTVLKLDGGSGGLIGKFSRSITRQIKYPEIKRYFTKSNRRTYTNGK